MVTGIVIIHLSGATMCSQDVYLHFQSAAVLFIKPTAKRCLTLVGISPFAPWGNAGTCGTVRCAWPVPSDPEGHRVCYLLYLGYHISFWSFGALRAFIQPDVSLQCLLLS